MIEVAFWFLSLTLFAQTNENLPVTGVITQVHSGDRLTIRTGRNLKKVRLANIFAPGLTQPFGPRSKQFLTELALNQKVTVEVMMVDKFDRMIADVLLADGRWLNDEMVAAGLAWHYRVAPKLKEHLARLEHQAMTLKLGLWLQKDPLPPWEHTREKEIPQPPLNESQADYDRIFHYGLLGDPKTKTYKWPGCHFYNDYKGKIIFPNLLEAEAQGFRLSRDCQHIALPKK